MEIRYARAPHAALESRYDLHMKCYVTPEGEVDEYGRIISPEGAEYTVLLGRDMSHSKDYKLRTAAYPETGFILQEPNTPLGSLDDFLDETGVRERLPPRRCLTAVKVPNGPTEWILGYRISPPERAPEMSVMSNLLASSGLSVERSGPRLYAWRPQEAET